MSKEEIKEAAELYAWKQYKNDPLLKKRDIATFIAGAEYVINNMWRVRETEGDPDKSMHTLVNLDGVYLACDYDKDKGEWWLCDGYISGYAPDGRPLYSSKTKLNEKEVAAIRTYMELPNEPH